MRFDGSRLVRIDYRQGAWQNLGLKRRLDELLDLNHMNIVMQNLTRSEARASRSGDSLNGFRIDQFFPYFSS